MVVSVSRGINVTGEEQHMETSSGTFNNSTNF
jgi:hypothetical protein